jgi:hypothetical protein
MRAAKYGVRRSRKIGVDRHGDGVGEVTNKGAVAQPYPWGVHRMGTMGAMNCRAGVRARVAGGEVELVGLSGVSQVLSLSPNRLTLGIVCESPGGCVASTSQSRAARNPRGASASPCGKCKVSRRR